MQVLTYKTPRLGGGVFFYHNACRVHSAHGQTPAQAAGLTDHQWSVEELLNQN